MAYEFNDIEGFSAIFISGNMQKLLLTEEKAKGQEKILWRIQQKVHKNFWMRFYCAIAPNDRFVKKVIKVLEFYKFKQGCSCCLLDRNDNPNNYETIDIKETVHYKDSNWVDYYMAECKKCNQKYKVYEREYHYTWWDWQRV